MKNTTMVPQLTLSPQQDKWVKLGRANIYIKHSIEERIFTCSKKEIVTLVRPTFAHMLWLHAYCQILKHFTYVSMMQFPINYKQANDLHVWLGVGLCEVQKPLSWRLMWKCLVACGCIWEIVRAYSKDNTERKDAKTFTESCSNEKLYFSHSLSLSQI